LENVRVCVNFSHSEHVVFLLSFRVMHVPGDVQDELQREVCGKALS